MHRKTFLKTTILGSITTSIYPLIFKEDKTHILTLSFDDGFRKSFLKIAEIYEGFGLKACLNVIASGHLPDFKQVDDWILPELMGDFNDWNQMVERGHEIMPHSWKHLNLTKQPLNEAIELILKCLEYFENNLDGYSNNDAVFNFPFNASTPELETFVLSKVRALRSSGESPVNGIPTKSLPLSLACGSRGPKNIDAWVQNQIDTFLTAPGGWLILNLHGLDDEGWGPISTTFLVDLLKKLSTKSTLEILPAGVVLKRTA